VFSEVPSFTNLELCTKVCGGISPNHRHKPFLCVWSNNLILKSMEWDSKVKMIQLGNQRYNSDEAKNEFQKFVLENVELFDGQAWDMFCNLVDLIIDEMKKDIEFWKQVYVKIKYVDCNDEKFGLRSGVRIAMIQTICEEELSFS